MRVLIADDEPLIRMGLKSMLEELGHEAVVAVDGRQAVQKAFQFELDMAILDINMPGTTGLQAAAALGRRRPLPIIFLTAFTDQELIEQAAGLPIHGYLVKPANKGMLAAAMAVAGRRFAESQELVGRAERLEEKLEDRKWIDRAKGQLMAGGLSEEAAYRAIQKQSRQRRKSMTEIAQEIVACEVEG